MDNIKEKLINLIREYPEDQLNEVAFEIYSEIVELVIDIGVNIDIMKSYIDDIAYLSVNPIPDFEVVKDEELEVLKQEKPYLFE